MAQLFDVYQHLFTKEQREAGDIKDFRDPQGKLVKTLPKAAETIRRKLEEFREAMRSYRI